MKKNEVKEKIFLVRLKCKKTMILSHENGTLMRCFEAGKEYDSVRDEYHTCFTYDEFKNFHYLAQYGDYEDWLLEHFIVMYEENIDNLQDELRRRKLKKLYHSRVEYE